MLHLGCNRFATGESGNKRRRKMKLIPSRYIGAIRRALFIKGTHKWNAWVRDFTARLEF